MWGLVGKGVRFRIRKFPIQTPPGARLAIAPQLRYETPGDLLVKISINNAVINMGLIRMWDYGVAK